MMKSLSVVIPTFNGLFLLEKYLPSVFEAIRFAQIKAEVIVVDDCSTDTTCQFLPVHFSSVRLFRNDTNQGFAETCNRGFREAVCDVVLCLNNDMELPEEFIAKQMELFSDPSVFGVMSRIMDATRTQVLESCKRVKRRSPFGFHIVDVPDDPNTSVCESFFICGGNAFYDRRKLLELKGFSTAFVPFYYEDVDLSLRAWEHGWRCLYTSRTECYHQHSATIESVCKKGRIRQASQANYLKLLFLHGDLSLRRKIIRVAQCKKRSLGIISWFQPRKRFKYEGYLDFLNYVNKQQYALPQLGNDSLLNITKRFEL